MNGSLTTTENYQISHSYSMPLQQQEQHLPPPTFPPPPLPPSLLKNIKEKQQQIATANTNFKVQLQQDILTTNSPLQQQFVLMPKNLLTLPVTTTLKQQPLVTTKNVASQQQISENLLQKTNDNNKNQTTKSTATGHSRKCLAIEYQLLEETDVPPQSPPRRLSEQQQLNKLPILNDENDPFDVQWLKSSIILKQIETTAVNSFQKSSKNSLKFELREEGSVNV